LADVLVDAKGKPWHDGARDGASLCLSRLTY
jgi:hypothetical protein